MRIVVLAPSGTVPGEAFTGFPAGSELTVVTWTAVPTTEGLDMYVLAPERESVRRIDRAVTRTAVGRVFRRLSPLDPGVRFWRTTRTDRAARELLADAGVIVAVERDAMYAAWRWARRRDKRGSAVVAGMPAARVAAGRLADSRTP